MIVKIIMKKDSKKNPPKKAQALRQSATVTTTQAETTTTPTLTTTSVSNVETPSSQPQPLFTRHELNQIRQRERIIAERKKREEDTKKSEQTLNQSSTASHTPLQTATSVTSSTSAKMSPIKSRSKTTPTSQPYSVPAKFQLDTPSRTATFQTPVTPSTKAIDRTSRITTPSHTPIRETSVVAEMRAIQRSIAEEPIVPETTDKNPPITTTTETIATEPMFTVPSDSQTQDKIQITMQIDPKAATFRKVQAPLQAMSKSLQQTAEITGQATVLIAIRRCPKCSKVNCECAQEPSTSIVSMETESTEPSLVALVTQDISQIVEQQEASHGRTLQDYHQQFGITTSNELMEPQRLVIDESMDTENTQAPLSPRVPIDPMQDELNRSRSTLSTPASQYMSVEEPA